MLLWFFMIKRCILIAEGKVVKLGKESIHVVVLGFCSAAIMSEDIRDEYKYKIVRTNTYFQATMHRILPIIFSLQYICFP